MNIITQILKDLKVELTEKFDNNFSRGGFFGKKWPNRRDGKPSHLNNTGTLRRSIKSTISGSTLTFTSSTPYSAIHNEGGEIVVTPKMKRYFWAMYKETKQDRYKAMALMKVGSKIKIPQRQFIGDYPGINKTIERVAKRAVEEQIQLIINKNKSK
ncbi:MAG: phage virion morphogenesis protein [Bacteroidales bacterium]|nr:phage virion morphogenesis protein [Bacteroidales bacterium]